jgi:large subunit ribosomal protein L10
MNGEALDAGQIRAISRLPSREVLYGQLVGIVASPITGLVRTLSALVGGLAIALSQVREQKQNQAEPASEPAQDDNQADASAQQQSDTAEATKED